jgi:DNA-binding transcriptional LysR family regulator
MDINWQQVRYFLWVADSGSVLKAAQANGVSQPTLSRKIKELESELGYALFKRSTQGLELTLDGSKLLETARKMADAADQFSRLASTRDIELNGDIRVSANEIVAHYLLPQVLFEFNQLYPQIKLDIVVDNYATNLSKREADIAIRMFKPKQVDLVIRRLPSIELGFFAHQTYLDENSSPKTLQELIAHQLIGFDANLSFISEAHRLGFELSRHDFALRSDSMLQQIALMQQGLGIAATHKLLGEELVDVEQVVSDVQLSQLDCYLVSHQDMINDIKMRTFVRFVGDWFDEHGYQYKV